MKIQCLFIGFNGSLGKRRRECLVLFSVSIIILFSPMVVPERLSFQKQETLSEQSSLVDESVAIVGSRARYYDSMGLGRPDYWVTANHNLISVHRIFEPNGPVSYRETQTLQHGMVVHILTERLTSVGAWRAIEQRSSVNGDFFDAVRFNWLLTGSL